MGEITLCDITKTDLINMWNNQNKICALSGRKMELNRKKGKWPYNCSIDRVDPAVGYTKENTHLICVHVNYMKGTMQIDEFIELCKHIGNH